MTDPGVTSGGRPAIVVDLARAGFTDAVEVGRGGFGVVFRCTQEALNRTVAVKLLHTDLDTVSRERFFREGRAMGGLSGHPNVVDVLQVGVTHSGRPYIVMPFQSLDSLAVRVRREGPIQWQEAARLGVRLAGALECAHRVGTLHRDVKPANILLSDYGEAQLTDFGIARIEGGFETATGAFTGSLVLLAPEVLNGRPPTRQSDIYGLAAALFSIIAGRAAFERREGEEIIAQFLRITGQPIPDLRGHGVPDELCAVLERAMAKDPADRPRLGRGVRARNCRRCSATRGCRSRRWRCPVGRRPSDKDAPTSPRSRQFEDSRRGAPRTRSRWSSGRGRARWARARRGAMPHASANPSANRTVGEHVRARGRAPGRAAARSQTAATAALSGGKGVDGATVVVGRPGATGWPSPGPRSGDTGPGTSTTRAPRRRRWSTPVTGPAARAPAAPARRGRDPAAVARSAAAVAGPAQSPPAAHRHRCGRGAAGVRSAVVGLLVFGGRAPSRHRRAAARQHRWCPRAPGAPCARTRPRVSRSRRPSPTAPSG